MIRLRHILLLVFGINLIIPAYGQISLDNISSISITDQINWNFERVRTYDFQIKFDGKIELWYTKQITRAEFEEKFNQTKLDSLGKSMAYHSDISRDSLIEQREKISEILKDDYQLYCDTVEPVFIKSLDSLKILRLLDALQDTSWSYSDLLNNYAIEDSSSSTFNGVMEYYPLIGMTVISKSGDTIIAYCESNGSLALPWIIPTQNMETYNPRINYAMEAILPKKMTFNRKRLVRGLVKRNKNAQHQ